MSFICLVTPERSVFQVLCCLPLKRVVLFPYFSLMLSHLGALYSQGRKTVTLRQQLIWKVFKTDQEIFLKKWPFLCINWKRQLRWQIQVQEFAGIQAVPNSPELFAFGALRRHLGVTSCHVVQWLKTEMSCVYVISCRGICTKPGSGGSEQSKEIG